MRMKSADKAKWLEALRSGEYTQTEGALCNDGKYCCLGVLEVVLDGDYEKNVDGTSKGSCTSDFLGRHGIEVELRSTGFENEPVTEYPKYAFSGVYGTLMELNDEMVREYDAAADEDLSTGDHVYSFSYIADYIEENVEVYD